MDNRLSLNLRLYIIALLFAVLAFVVGLDLILQKGGVESSSTVRAAAAVTDEKLASLWTARESLGNLLQECIWARLDCRELNKRYLAARDKWNQAVNEALPPKVK